MIVVLLASSLACATYLAYLTGRVVEVRKWKAQRAEAYQIVDKALEARKEARRAFEVQMDVIRTQRELINTFAIAADIIGKRDDFYARRQLSWASHRARTELL